MGDDNQFEAVLRQYPSNFDLLEEVQLMSKEYVKKVKEKLLQETETTPYDTDMETLRAWNLISFLSFVLGIEAEAFEYNSKVLELSKYNMFGLCNKAWFLVKKQEQFYTVKEICEQLKEQITNGPNLLVAKAEKAFCYSRFGVNRYEKSRLLFEEVLTECENINDIDVHTECKSKEPADCKMASVSINSICVWNFGYALTFKRTLNLNNVHNASSLDFSKKIYVKVCALYSRIIDMKGQSSCLDRYKARSYVEIGSLVYNVRKNKSRFPQGVKDVLPKHRHLWMQTEMYYIKALEICPSDIFVLERSGKFFRYINKVDKSVELLTRAIKIRDTAFAHHHLALSLKRQLELKLQNSSFSFPDAMIVVSKEKQNVSRSLYDDFGDNGSTEKTKRCLSKSHKFEANFNK